jgi:pimeloyl-ACP methyl ester carboxylesterase
MNGTTVILLLVGVAAMLAATLVLFTAGVARRVERAVPPAGQFVEINGARIHYIDRGQGPVTLLMVHGLGGNAHNFLHSLVARLDTSYRVVVMERPGSGYSTRAAGAAAGPIAQADTVAAFIRALKLDRPVLVGHSLGGAISLATAVAHPTLVRALALIAPLTRTQDAPPDVFKALFIQSALVRTIVGWTFATPLGMIRRSAMLNVIFGPDPVPPDFALAGGGALGMRPSAFVSASTDAMAVAEDMPRLLQQYGALTMPVSILYGTHDRILDPTHHGAALTTLVPQLQLELIDGAGHMLPLTAPDRVARFVRQVAAMEC